MVKAVPCLGADCNSKINLINKNNKFNNIGTVKKGLITVRLKMLVTDAVLMPALSSNRSIIL